MGTTRKPAALQPRVVDRRELRAAADPEARRREPVADYRARLMHPYRAPEEESVDDVIGPADTRAAVADALAVLRDKRREQPRRKHGDVPL